jgi:hypothetical protein
MMLVCRLTSLICCSSQKPSSRRRCETSGGVESCLIRTAVPATTRLKGQRKGSFVQPFSPKQLDIKPFTVPTKLLLVRLCCKNQNSMGSNPQTRGNHLLQAFTSRRTPRVPDYQVPALTSLEHPSYHRAKARSCRAIGPEKHGS